jgi:hypothetical protein
MWPSLRRSAMMLALVACGGLAAAQSGLGGRGTSENLMDDETTGTLGPIDGRRAAGSLALSDEQRGRIYEGVMTIPDAPVVDVPAPELADALPSGVPLQDLPAGVTREIPLVQGHKFVKFDDRILVIDPTSRLVVAMIPRYKLVQ